MSWIWWVGRWMDVCMGVKTDMKGPWVICIWLKFITVFTAAYWILGPKSAI
jgi:hypothetical protein